MALWFRASASCNIILQSAIKIDIALTQVPYLYNISYITQHIGILYGVT